MEIHQLRYFVAVAEEGSFSRAAAKVRVAQPSLSQQIRKLEAEVGQPLFDRLPRSVVLTEAGRCLIDYARQILASIGDARRCVDELKGEVAGKVAVGAIPTIAPYVLPELVVTFQKHYPDVTLEIVEDVTEGVTRRIDAGELDVALASTCRPSPTLRRESLGTEPLLALVPEERSRGIRRSQIAEVSTASRDALPVATGESPPRVTSSPAGDCAGGQPAQHNREHGRGLDRRFHRTSNDGETSCDPGMRQSAVRSAGSGAGAQSPLQSASISEQSRRSVPSGSRGCFVTKGFVDHSQCKGVKLLSHSFQRHRYHR
jgi:DNA-binding transcriptional LysR family regulator